MGKRFSCQSITKRVQDDGVKVVDFIREWEWYRQWEDSSNTRVVDETPDIILTSDFSYSDENETQIDGTTCVYKEDEDKAKVLVKIYIGVSVYKQMLYNPGEKIRLPECYPNDRYTISEWRYSLKEAAHEDESDIVSYVTPDITVPQGIKSFKYLWRIKHAPSWAVPDTTKTANASQTNAIQTSGQQSEVKDTTPPVIKNIKNKKKYKKSKVTVYVKDNDELYKVTVNGKK